MARTDTLGNFLTDVADAIRTKAGTSSAIQASAFDTAISNIPSGGRPTPTSWADYLTAQEELCYNFMTGMRNTYNDPIYLYNEPKTLYTPDAEFTTYIIRYDRGTYNIFWFKPKAVFCCNSYGVSYPGVLYFNNFYLNTLQTLGENNIKFQFNQNMTYEYYQSGGFTSYDDAVAGILSNTTSYSSKTSGSGIGTADVSSTPLTTNTFFIYPSGDHNFTYQVKQISASENIQAIS